MKKLFTQYINTFSGLSREVWWLSLITLINRAGTMVIPFLSLYLTEDLKFTVSEVGWIMSFFGLGSVVGSWLGGKLTDKIGYYKVMLVSLIGTGILFVFLQFATTFHQFCVGIFSVMLVADAFRPAMFVALSAYSNPENKIRSVTLIRLAINLGFSVGPAVGGLMVISIGYQGLFWIDGVTCLLAAVLLLNVLHPQKVTVLDKVTVENPVSAYKDKSFWIFFVAMFIFGFVFLQYFSTVPLYYKEVRFLSEFQIGLLLGFSGLFIFVFEMPMIQWLNKPKNSKVRLIAIGLFLVSISYLVLNLSDWVGILLVGMLLMTIGEMIAFPFSNAFAVDRAKKGNQGEYMALYSISFSLAHIFSHNSGMQMIAKYGFEFTWNFMMILALVGVAILLILLRVLKKEQLNQSK
jgi:predicted MFS family arabinose efflux permease